MIRRVLASAAAFRVAEYTMHDGGDVSITFWLEWKGGQASIPEDVAAELAELAKAARP